MTLDVSHYNHKSITDAKFECASFFYFWRYDVTNFPSEEGNESSNLAIYPLKLGLTFEKLVFISRIVLLYLKLTPHVNFSNFQAEENFSFCTFLGPLDHIKTSPKESWRGITLAQRPSACHRGWSIASSRRTSPDTSKF